MEYVTEQIKHRNHRWPVVSSVKSTMYLRYTHELYAVCEGVCVCVCPVSECYIIFLRHRKLIISCFSILFAKFSVRNACTHAHSIYLKCVNFPVPQFCLPVPLPHICWTYYVRIYIFGLIYIALNFCINKKYVHCAPMKCIKLEHFPFSFRVSLQDSIMHNLMTQCCAPCQYESHVVHTRHFR